MGGEVPEQEEVRKGAGWESVNFFGFVLSLFFLQSCHSSSVAVLLRRAPASSSISAVPPPRPLPEVREARAAPGRGGAGDGRELLPRRGRRRR